MFICAGNELNLTGARYSMCLVFLTNSIKRYCCEVNQPLNRNHRGATGVCQWITFSLQPPANVLKNVVFESDVSIEP